MIQTQQDGPVWESWEAFNTPECFPQHPSWPILLYLGDGSEEVENDDFGS